MRLIDADALWTQMKEFYEKRAEEANMTGDRVVCVTWHDAVIFIKNAPTADVVERKTGQWYDVGSLSCRCSNCGCKSQKEYLFCPHCGADTRGERDG